MHTLYIGLGSNLGDRAAHLARARTYLRLSLGPPAALSGIYRTAAWGVTDQPDFFNQVAAYRSRRPPLYVLRLLLKIEVAAGRVRERRWGSRTLDLDLLAYGPHRSSTDVLTLPHPRIAERNFVLAPLTEIAPELLLPGRSRTVAELYAASPDRLPVALVQDTVDPAQ